MKTCIAERRLILEDIKTGERKNLNIRIGLPKWVQDAGFASCEVEYEGLFDKVADVCAMDTLLALELASDVDLVLRGHIEKYRFYWLDGEPYDVDAHLEDKINIIEQTRKAK